MSLVFDAVVCGVVAVGAAVAVTGIKSNTSAIDDILVAMLDKEA